MTAEPFDARNSAFRAHQHAKNAACDSKIHRSRFALRGTGRTPRCITGLHPFGCHEASKASTLSGGGFEGAFDVFEVFGGGEFVVERAEDSAIGVDHVGDAQGVIDDR